VQPTIIASISALLVLVLAVPASAASAEQPVPSAVVVRPAPTQPPDLIESGAIPLAGVVVGTLMIVGGLWSPRRDRRPALGRRSGRPAAKGGSGAVAWSLPAALTHPRGTS
jgi:hypothetical protein